jgi:hypothetical protein
MLNTINLLRSVADQTKNAVDLRTLSCLWEALHSYVQNQIRHNKPVRIPNLADVTTRTVELAGFAKVEAHTFLLSQAFVAAYNLLDRRPKTSQLVAEPLPIDMRHLTQLTIERLGEIISRAAVESALAAIIDAIGTACADEKRGTIMIDFGFGRLLCENRSVEFLFSKEAMPAAAAPSDAPAAETPAAAPVTPPSLTTAATTAPAAAASPPPTRRQELLRLRDEAEGLGFNASDVPGLPPRSMRRQRERTPFDGVERAPLQRSGSLSSTTRSLTRVTSEDCLHSHSRQIELKRAREQRERERNHRIDGVLLEKVRGELVELAEQRKAKRESVRRLVEEQRRQQADKVRRDAEARRPFRLSYFPFRTEEQSKEQARSVNAEQKARLDAQIRERSQVRALTHSVAQIQMADEMAAARDSVCSSFDETTRREQAAEATRAAVETTLTSAYSRYERYLNERRSELERVRADSATLEQRAGEEQSLKREEQRRKVGEMQAYLERQMADRAQRNKVAHAERISPGPAPTLSRDASALSLSGFGDSPVAARAALKKSLEDQVAQKLSDRGLSRQATLRGELAKLDELAVEIADDKARKREARRQQIASLRSEWQRQNSMKGLVEDISSAHFAPTSVKADL